MLRRFAALLALLLTAAACIAADLSIALSPAQLSLRLRTEAQPYICQPFDFESVRFSFSDGLKVRKLRVGDPEQPALSADSITIKVDLRKLEVRKIEVDRPAVFLRIKPNGSTNFDNLLVQPSGEASSSAGAALPAVGITEGSFRANVGLSENENLEAVLSGINGVLSPDADSGDTSLSVTAMSKELGRIEVEGLLSAGFKNGLVDVRVREMEIAKLTALLPAAGKNIVDDLQLKGRVSAHARVKLEDGKPDFAATVESLGCTVQYVGLPAFVEDIRGRLDVTPEAVLLKDFTGQTHGNPVNLQGRIDFTKAGPEITLDITAEDMQASEGLLQAVPETERKIIQDFAPRGSADLRVNVLKPAGSTKPRITVQVDANGAASIAYVEFPYRLDELTGTLLVTPEKIEIKKVSSVTGSQTVVGNGYVVPLEDGVELNILITGKDVVIDDRLREALAEEDRETWDIFNPAGTANIEVKIESPPDDKEISVDVKAPMNGFASVTPKPFPFQISGISGVFSIPPEGGVRLTGIRGRASGGLIEIADTVIPPNMGKATVDAAFTDVGVGRDLIDALSSAIDEDLKDLSAGGKTSGQLHLRRPEGSDEFEMTAEVKLNDGWLKHEIFPLKAEDLEGMLLVRRDGYFLRSLVGRAAGGRLEAWGELLELPADKQKLRLRIEGFDILADEKIRESLPEDLLDVWDDFQPYGRGDVAIWLDGDMPFEKMKKSLAIRPRYVSGKYVEFPYPVSGAAGDIRIDIDTGNVEIRDLHTLDGKIRLSGTVRYELVEGKEYARADLDIEAKDIELDNALRDAMPEEIREVWKDIELEGVSSGSIKLHMEKPAGSDWSIDYKIGLRPGDCRMEAGFPLKKLHGRVELEGHVSDKGDNTLKSGLILLRRFTVSGLPVTWISAPAQLTDESLTLGPITGRMANGTISGSLQVMFDEDASYSGQFEVKQASVKQAAEELFGEKMEKTTGRADAWIAFQGKGSDDQALRGKGDVKLSKSNLWQVPFFSALVKAISAGVVPGVDFTESSAHFRIEGDKLHFRKVRFISPVMKLKGAGTLTLDGGINFIFRVNLVSSLFRLLPVVKQIMESVEGQLFAVRATGTAKKVKITVAPETVLEALEELEKLTKEAPDEQETPPEKDE